MKQSWLPAIEPSFVDRGVSAVTFRGKLDLPIHRWYRLTPSFSPQLAEDIAAHFRLGPKDFVLDPFSGVGTVPLCMKYHGIPSCSVEINPYLHFVGSVKTRTRTDAGAIAETFARFVADYRRDRGRTRCATSPDKFLSKHAADVPAITHPERWWSPGNLAQLVRLRQTVREFVAPADHLDLIKLGVLGILVPVSNARHNHVSLTFAKEPAPTHQVADVLERQLQAMADDVRVSAERPGAEATVYLGNSKSLGKVLPTGTKVSAVITSPPYPNRFSYARETRPHLFFFDFIESAGAVGRMETEAIGGTWGHATSVLSKGVEPQNECVARLLDPHLRGAPENGSLMASYVVKYFNDLYDHAAQIAKVCKKQARLAYVIGNSQFFGNPLPSDELLAAIFGEFGFALERIDRMRKRQSKTGLHEAVVFLRRG